MRLAISITLAFVFLGLAWLTGWIYGAESEWTLTLTLSVIFQVVGMAGAVISAYNGGKIQVYEEQMARRRHY